MVSKAFDVTVHDPVTRSITVEQVESYVRRNGRTGIMPPPLVPEGVEWNTSSILSSAIDLLAAVEDRLPGEVLDDIANERP